LHLDPESVKSQKAKEEARVKERKDNAAKKSADKAKSKAAETAEKAKEQQKLAENAQAKLDGKKVPHPELEENK